MAPPETRRGDPRQGRPSIAAFNNGGRQNSISQNETPVLSELIAEALAQGMLVSGGRFKLCGWHLRPAGGR